jgi:hypothetical protein
VYKGLATRLGSLAAIKDYESGERWRKIGSHWIYLFANLSGLSIRGFPSKCSLSAT